MNKNIFTINTNVAISTSTYTKGITMNNDTASICKPVDREAIKAKLHHLQTEIDKSMAYSNNELETMSNEIASLKLLRGIVLTDEWSVSAKVDEAPSTDKLIPSVADVVTKDQARTAIDELGWRLAKTAAGGRSWAKVARACGYTVMGDDTQVTLVVHFTPGDKDAYLRHSSNMRSLIGRCPRTQSGTTWGDDGVATRINEESGSIRLNAGGVSKRFVAGLR